MLNKKLIQQKKEIYGDNFECIANEWSFVFQKNITAKQVAEAMAKMKKCRMIAIKSKLEKIMSNDTMALKKLNNALKDTIKDMGNYEWIAQNYEEYKRL